MIMTIFANVMIASNIVVPPSDNSPTDDIINYIENIIQLDHLLQTAQISFYITDTAFDSLSSDGFCPFDIFFYNYFKKNDIIEYSYRDISNTLSNIFERFNKYDKVSNLTDFNTFYSINNVEYDCIDTEPDILNLTNYPNIESEFNQCILMLAVLNKYCNNLPSGLHLVMQRCLLQLEIRVTASNLSIQHSRADLRNFPSPCENFDGHALVCGNVSGLISCLDRSAILAGASDDLDISFAVRIALYQFEADERVSPMWHEVIVPRIGSQFRMKCR
jgi:hypothetical protein